MTPTAIGHQIGLLEQYCGRALFRRRPRPLSLTDAGARLFPAIRSGLEVFAAIIASVKQEGDQQALRVTTTNAFDPHHASHIREYARSLALAGS